VSKGERAGASPAAAGQEAARSREAALLALDTSTTTASVAVGRGEDVLAEILVGARLRGTDALLPAIDDALRAAGVATAELGGVVVSGGPGSFTGVRLAAATAKGMVRALGVPLYAYSGLLAVAAGAGAADRAVCALFDARRGEVYAACYRLPGYARVETLLEPAALPLGDAIERVRAFSPLYAGEGALQQRAVIEAAGGDVAPSHLAPPRAAALLWLARTAPELGRVADPGAWQPEYVRPPAVERVE
jgi:tRNA threonylcarbamoyladenosine biosynthesis protein TsaB